MDRRDDAERDGHPQVTRVADASGEIPRPVVEPERLRDDPRTLRRMLRADVTPGSLRRSDDTDHRARRVLQRGGRRSGGLGYQPGLDGLRALSVLVVLCYHAGFGWMPGGWIGVEVFFVVSGFLITTLLIEERERNERVALGQFWLRRARRLLPALLVMLLVVATITLIVGSASARGDVRRDLPWTLAYLGNWGQILGDVPYYATDPPLLRHLWSLAIEEQFYLVWPLVFVGLMRTRMRAVSIAALLAGTALVVMAWTWVLHGGGPGPLALFGGVDRVNFMYLSTFTRSTGLLLGAAAAFVWRPWRGPVLPTADPGRTLDRAGVVALSGLGIIAATATLTAGYVYQWLLPMVTLLALALVLVIVHPAAHGILSVMSWRPLVVIGTRSYGLYLWHWPIFVLLGATHGSVARFVVAAALAAVATELSYRYVETPVRQGHLGRWWRRAGPERSRVLLIASGVVISLGGLYATVQPFDRAAGGADATFEAPAATPTTVAAAAPAGTTVPTTGAPAAGAAAVPAVTGVAVVGDSQAHALAINKPNGIDGTFRVTDGSLDGCSVYDAGRVRSARTSFHNHFGMCEGWQQKWAAAVTNGGASIALVVLGAWDVFDLETNDGNVLPFGTPAWDAYVRQHLQSGIDALVAAGAHVALLEVPCMRPISVKGAAVPPLPERGDDAHVAHVNDLWRSVAAANPSTTTFVTGPAWCTDTAMATDVGMRWDGVHVYKPGAKAIFDTIAPALLAI
jgi:peptidoglycan/LPS O-acetylase OafA/YrhL